MNKRMLCKVSGALVSFVLGLLPTLSVAGEFEAITPSKHEYKLSLGAIGPQVASDINTTIDADLVWTSPPKVDIEVFEPLDAGQGKPKWVYRMGPLSVGDDFVVQGRMYRITDIDVKDVRLVSPYKLVGWGGCNRTLCWPSAEIVSLPRVVSSSGRNALVLSKIGILPSAPPPDGSVSIYASSDECVLRLYLDGLTKKQHGYVAHLRFELNASYYKNDISKCHEKVKVGRADLRSGEVINFGDFGRFGVESIWPAESNHEDWVILVPTNGTKKGSGSFLR